MANQNTSKKEKASKKSTRLPDAPIDIGVLNGLKEIDPRTHAGCYELVQKAVELYGKMKDQDHFTVADLDMVFHFIMVEQKKEDLDHTIALSCLPDVSKNELKLLLTTVWTNQTQYENSDVGIVGMGSRTFRAYHTKDDDASTLIRTLVEISSKESRDDIFQATEKLPRIRGVNVATLSAILHCLKPDVFPIWNNKSKNYFPRLQIEPPLSRINGKGYKEYIENSKRLCEFRDANNLPFKNWRAVDMLAYSDSSGDSKTANNDSKNAGESSGLETEFKKWLNIKFAPRTVNEHYIPAFHDRSFHDLFQADPFTISTAGQFQEMVDKMKKDQSLKFQNLNSKGSTGNGDLSACIEKYVEFLSLFRSERNLIYFGAPGTGKSHKLTDSAEKQFSEQFFKRVTFYPTYSYAQFVGCYKPVMEPVDGKDEIAYEFIPGPFLRVLVEALNDPAHNYCLVVEEINRANAAAVFGDVFQLLDRATKDSTDNLVKKDESEYDVAASVDVKKYLRKVIKSDEGRKFLGMIDKNGKEVFCEDGTMVCRLRIPSNMYIWATMNSADQGVFPMDTAFKRRWEFEYVGIDDDATDELKKWTIGDTEYKWNEVRTLINQLLSTHGVNEDKLMGPWFVKPEKGTTISDSQFKSKVLMYLWEDAARMCRQKMFGKNILTYSDLIGDRGWGKKGVWIFEDDGEFKELSKNQQSWDARFPSLKKQERDEEDA